LAHVRAGGLLADRVQVLLANQPRDRAVALAAGRSHPKPRRLALAQGTDRRTEHAEHVHPARIRPRARGAHARAPEALRRDAASEPRRSRAPSAPAPAPTGWAWRGVRPARSSGGISAIPRRAGATVRWRRPCAWQK